MPGMPNSKEKKSGFKIDEYTTRLVCCNIIPNNKMPGRCISTGKVYKSVSHVFPVLYKLYQQLTRNLENSSYSRMKLEIAYHPAMAGGQGIPEPGHTHCRRLRRRLTALRDSGGDEPITTAAARRRSG
jgi:hypothetical protein